MIGSRKYFDREGIYDDPSTREGYPITWSGSFFYEGSIELIQRLGIPFDIIHCHDSHTALVPGLIHRNYGDPLSLLRRDGIHHS
jgi:starch synthase